MGWWHVCRRTKCLFEHQDKCHDSGRWLNLDTYMRTWPIARCDLCKKLSWRPFEVYPLGREFKGESK